MYMQRRSPGAPLYCCKGASLISLIVNWKVTFKHKYTSVSGEKHFSLWDKKKKYPFLAKIGAVPFNVAIRMIQGKKKKEEKKSPPCYAKYHRNLFSITVVTGHFALHWWQGTIRTQSPMPAYHNENHISSWTGTSIVFLVTWEVQLYANQGTVLHS